MKSETTVYKKLAKKRAMLYDKKKRRHKFFLWSYFKQTSTRPILWFIIITYILVHFIKGLSSFKILKERTNFYFNSSLHNDQKGYETYYGRKNVIHYKRRPIFKKGIINYNKKFKLKSAKVDKIIESLKELTLLEASELVKKIEVTFSVDTKQSIGGSKDTEESKNDSNTNDEEEEDENKVYDLILESIEPNKKIPIIKIVKEIKKDLNLKQAKDLVDNLPQTLFEKINKETVDKWKTKLTEAGGIVKLK
ncbi:50S ribosomal protein L12, apicoplast, putative [Plasmodium ovale]|uniref:50S ribosomal protein L12, apicoplast, putative n=1 Tax=Plasmodium ovale TaxID=36330 RepID=A0A1C3KTH0_PLAOA|nr:50S ribosomal protein L12, apicoplast, putative [Plasmodium ovale]